MAITSFKKKYKDEMTGEWSCPLCEIKMDSQHAFTVHIRQHNPTDHSHTCGICGKQLSSASSLDRHALIHSGERPFKCRICNMAFTTNGNMHRHMRTHGQEQQQAVGYIPSSHIDEDGLRVRTKKKRKTKSLPNSDSPVNNQSNNSFNLNDLSLKEGFLALLQLQNQNRGYNDFNFDSLSQKDDLNNSTSNYFNQFNKLNLNSSNHKELTENGKLLINDELEDSEHRSTTSSEEQQENLLNKSSFHDEINKLAFKRSLAQNSTLYNTLLNCNNFATTVSLNSNSTSNKSDLADINSILNVISNVTPMLANVTADLSSQTADEQIAKLNQLRQQTLQDSILLNSSTTVSSNKQTGKRPRNDNRSQINNSTKSTNSTNGKRIKRESKDSCIENDFDLDSLQQLNNNLKNNNLINSLSSLNSITNLMKEDDEKSDKSNKSNKNSSDIENEMINGKLNKLSNKLNSSTSQEILNNLNTSHDTVDEDELNLSEEEEANKMEQELCEQEEQEELLKQNSKKRKK